MRELSETTVKAFAWTGTAKAIEQAISWAISIWLVRLLVPEDYGLMALATMSIQFVNYFSELSLGAGLVQKRDVDDVDLSSTFWFLAASGTAAATVIYSLAAFIEGFFGMARLSDILRVLSLNCVINGLGTIPHCMLDRELQFDRKARIDIVANLSMGVVALTLANAGQGVWSLVCGSLSRNLSFTVQAYCTWPYRPRLLFSWQRLREVVSFGLHLSGSKILAFVYYNVDNLIIGKSLGKTALGYYYTAFHFTTMPVEKLSMIINQVNFPIFARLRDHAQSVKFQFLGTTKYITLAIFPAMAGLFLTAEGLVRYVFGSKWLPIVEPLQILCVIGAVRAMAVVIPPLLMGKGRADALFKYSLASTVVMTGAILIGVRYGINGVAWAWVLVYPFLFAYLLGLALRESHVTLREYAKTVAPSLAATTGMVIAVKAYQSAAGSMSFVGFVGSVIIGVAVYGGMLMVLHREVVAEVKAAIGMIKAQGYRVSVLMSNLVL